MIVTIKSHKVQISLMSLMGRQARKANSESGVNELGLMETSETGTGGVKDLSKDGGDKMGSEKLDLKMKVHVIGVPLRCSILY